MNQSDSASFWGWPSIVAFCVLLLDQATKWLTVFLCPQPGLKECVVIPGVLRLVHWRNQGAAFSLFYGHKFILGILSLVVCLGLIWTFKSLFGKINSVKWAGAFLIGGVVGNLIDRFFYVDGVIDFIRFECWPAFNIADSAITCSMVWIVWKTWHNEICTRNGSPKAGGGTSEDNER